MSSCKRCGDGNKYSAVCDRCQQAEVDADGAEAAIAAERERILTAIEAEFHPGRTCTRQRLAAVIAKLREGSK